MLAFALLAGGKLRTGCVAKLSITRNMACSLRDYISTMQDPFDKERIQLIGTIKEEGKRWISEYARGGSAPGQAAKRMYVAVDSVVGHVAANGAAPFPKPKVKFVKETLAQVDKLVEGKQLSAAAYQ